MTYYYTIGSINYFIDLPIGAFKIAHKFSKLV